MNMRQQVRKVRERASRSSPMVRSGIQSRFIRNSHRRVPTYHMKFFNVKFSDKLTLFVLSEMKSFPTKFQKICSAHKYSILLCTRKLYCIHCAIQYFYLETAVISESEQPKTVSVLSLNCRHSTENLF